MRVILRSDETATVNGLVAGGVASAILPRLAVDPHDDRVPRPRDRPSAAAPAHLPHLASRPPPLHGLPGLPRAHPRGLRRARGRPLRPAGLGSAHGPRRGPPPPARPSCPDTAPTSIRGPARNSARTSSTRPATSSPPRARHEDRQARRPLTRYAVPPSAPPRAASGAPPARSGGRRRRWPDSALTRGSSVELEHDTPNARRAAPRRAQSCWSARVVAEQRDAVDRARRPARARRRPRDVERQRLEHRRGTSSRVMPGRAPHLLDEERDDLGIELRAGAPRSSASQACSAGRGVAVGPLVGHRAVGLEHRERAGGERDLVARQARRIAPAVEALVVVEHGVARRRAAPAPG